MLQGSCQVPLAVFAQVDGARLIISGMVGMPDGSQLICGEQAGSSIDVERLSAALADDLLSQGAGRIIADLA